MSDSRKAHASIRPTVYAQRVVYHRAKALGSLRELARMAVETGQDPAPYRAAEAMLGEAADATGSRSLALGPSTMGAVAEMLVSLGVSRAELARRMGVVPPRVTQMLTRRQNVTLSTMARIAEALGVKAFVVLEAPRTGEERLVPPKRQKGVM